MTHDIGNPGPEFGTGESNNTDYFVYLAAT